MKRLIFALMVIALLVPMATAFADDKTPPPPGSCLLCEDSAFVATCRGWRDVVVKAFSDTLGLHINVKGAVGPLPYTANDETAVVVGTVDGVVTCTGKCGSGVLDPTGPIDFGGRVLGGSPLYSETGLAYDLNYDIPASKIDVLVPHYVSVVVAQEGCVNCPHRDYVEVDAYIPPPPPPEECVDHKLYQMATFEFPSGKTGTLVSWDGYPANTDRQLCHFGEIAVNTPIFEWVYKDSCTGAITYNGETYLNYDPEMEKPHWHDGACLGSGC